MPQGSGLGDYAEAGTVIPCRYQGRELNFLVQMFVSDVAAITNGREIWGFPKKYGEPKLEVRTDTLTGSLRYDGELVALGTMPFEREPLSPDEARQAVAKPQAMLKLVPAPDGRPAICQLTEVSITEATVKSAWKGPARLHLVPHANAPVADFPVRRVIEAKHFLTDLTLPYGRVLHDYLAAGSSAAQRSIAA